jgi:hypothetical protein
MILYKLRIESANCITIFRFTSDSGSAQAFSPSLNHQPRSTSPATSAAAKGAAFAKNQAWLEIMGCGIDPEIWSGYAFGMGVDRTGADYFFASQ